MSMKKKYSAGLIFFLFFLFAFPLFAQEPPATPSGNGGCGANQAQFDVTGAKKNGPAAQPEAGKALVYVIEDIAGGPTMRVGMDGSWIGANKGKSYLFFSADPGDHQVCTKWQSGVFKKTAERMGSATTITVEAGRVYYLRIQAFQRSERDWTITIDPVEPAEGEFLVSSSLVSTSRLKK
ncbi:MAG TPA: DUF2846 domain-containing protein [Candidatus Acidoferrum sp.]|nr:DUF2846 domain-containing protein [Candidatus Acidoferrum sp.]